MSLTSDSALLPLPSPPDKIYTSLFEWMNEWVSWGHLEESWFSRNMCKKLNWGYLKVVMWGNSWIWQLGGKICKSCIHSACFYSERSTQGPRVAVECRPACYETGACVCACTSFWCAWCIWLIHVEISLKEWILQALQKTECLHENHIFYWSLELWFEKSKYGLLSTGSASHLSLRH